MPLVLQASVAWALGSVLGLGGVGAAAGLTVGIGLGFWLLWRAIALPEDRRWRVEGTAALLLLFVVALSLGADLRQRDRRCEAQALTAREWQVRLTRDAEPTGFATGRIERMPDAAAVAPNGAELRCQLRVALAVRSGEAAAGSLVRVRRAEASAGERGLLLRDAALSVIELPGPLGRWRNRVAATITRRFGSDAGMAKALLIADTEGLSMEMRERYADAGLVHILSISGLHVGIIGAALLLLVEAARLPATAGRVGAVLIVGGYVLAIGAPAAAVRSAALFMAMTATRLLQRPTSPWATFAIGAMLPLLQPRTVLDLGWQLSVSGYAGLIAAGRLARRVFAEPSQARHGDDESWRRRWSRGWRATLARELIAGALTTAVTAPLVAWHFGRLSLVAVISNLGAGPVVALLQPTLFLAMLAPGDTIGTFVADAARPLMRALDGVAAAAAALPGAAVNVAPTLATVLLSAAAATAVIVAAWARHWRSWATIACAAVAVLAWLPDLPLQRSAGMEVHMIDVGQGDAIALRTPAGRWVLIDAGRSWSSGDAGRATVIPYLRRRGGELALFVVTHPHADHIGGAASVVDALRPREIRDAAFVAGSGDYAEMLRAAESRGSAWARVRPGERMELDGVILEFLAPDSAWTATLSDPNEASTILRVQYGARSLLLTGDAEHALEDWLLRTSPDALDVDVLKVAHHGSSTSSGEGFLDAVSPRVAMVSVGRENSYGHPSAEVMQRLLDHGASVLRSDQLGGVVLRTDGHSWEVEAAGLRWPVREASPPLP